MSDPLRTDGAHAHADVTSASDRDAKIEQLLLVGLDHYFASRYELAINIWTRALFLDRSHARARAYIDRARSALAERQRESEELLQTGVAAFQRGDRDEARRLLQAAIEGGAPSEEALAVLDRLNRFELDPSLASSPRSDRASRDRTQPVSLPGVLSNVSTVTAVAVVVGTIVIVVVLAAWSGLGGWGAFSALATAAQPSEAPVSAPVLDESLPLPRRGDTALVRARTLAAGGHLHDALAALDAVRLTDPQYADANRLRADIQQQLLAVTPLPAAAASGRGNGEPRDR